MDLKTLKLKVVDSIKLAQNSDQWRPLVNREMNIQFPWKIVIFLSS